MFLRYLIKVDEGEILEIYFLHIQFIQENFINVYKGLIKVEKGEILRLYFKHICVLLLLSVFPGRYFYAVSE